MTASRVIDPEIGMTLEDENVEIMGTSKKVIITKDDTIIIDGQGDKE